MLYIYAALASQGGLFMFGEIWASGERPSDCAQRERGAPVRKMKIREINVLYHDPGPGLFSGHPGRNGVSGAANHDLRDGVCVVRGILDQNY